MGVSYSQDLRDRVIAARDGGMTTRQVSKVMRVSESWIRRVMQRRRENGQTTPRPRGGATVIKIDMDRLRQLVEAQPDATTKELHQRLGIKCSMSAVGFALKRLGFTFKKRQSMLPNRIGPMSQPNAPNGSRNSPRSIPKN
jgi:transposase